jgi:hypothetical protein
MPLKIIPEANKPLPDDFESEEPTSFEKKVKIAAATAKILLEAGAEIPSTPEDKKEAEDLFKAFTDPNSTQATTSAINKSLSVPSTVQHLYAMLKDYDHQVIDEAVQLRRFVTNKLLEDTGHTDARHRLKALELLGKISDVGLFTDKTEITINAGSIDNLEDQIRSKLFKILGTNLAVDTSFEVIDAEMGEIKPDDKTT